MCKNLENVNHLKFRQWLLLSDSLYHMMHGWKFEISKILNFKNSKFLNLPIMPTKLINFIFKWLIVFR